MLAGRVMKVFWSWQSDHSGNVSRHFIREALEAAIKAINAEIIDADRPNVFLDHDRKGAPGSPDLAALIFSKISASQVFVADVTPVGRVNRKKKLINHNVAIELGYSLAAIGDEKLIMVMNGHYGTYSDLPFDLIHKAGPIIYNLKPDASAQEIKLAHGMLAGKFKAAIGEILSTQKNSQNNAVEPFEPTKPISEDRSRFVAARTALAIRNGGSTDEVRFRSPAGPITYLRVMPTIKQPMLRRAEAMALARGSAGGFGLIPFYYSTTGILLEANEGGVIAFEHDGSDSVACGVQLFLNRELWAFDNVSLGSRKAAIPMKSVEQTYRRCLPAYLRFVERSLGVQPPYKIEAGASSVGGAKLHYKENDYGWDPQPSLIDQNVIFAGELVSTAPATVDQCLLMIFEAFYDAAGVVRPTGLYGFPATADKYPLSTRLSSVP